MIRWLKFNAVGAIGAGVQLAMLAALTKFGVQYLVATALAVETAVLHNYIWHVNWTWKDRPGNYCSTLWRFHLGNGLISVVSNLIWMRIFAGWLGMPVLAANVLAISITSVANFFLGDRWVFSRELS